MITLALPIPIFLGRGRARHRPFNYAHQGERGRGGDMGRQGEVVEQGENSYPKKHRRDLTIQIKVFLI